MDSSRQAKIQLLSRVNLLRAATPEFIEALSKAIKQTVEVGTVVSVEESDALLEIFRSGYRTAQNNGAVSYRRFFPPKSRSLVLRLAACIADYLINEDVYFLTKLGGDSVAITVKLSALLRQAGAVIDFDGDSIAVVSTDRSQGLLIDSNQGDPVQAFEVAAWGDRWPLLVIACDHV
jgi:hypothetical protein